MLFAEESARFWLVVHAILGAALVAVATHMLVWVWPYLRGRTPRHRGVRIFATVGLCLYVAQFTVGNVIYVPYKVRVRAEYLDLPSAVAADDTARAEARKLVDARVGTSSAAPAARGELSSPARLFDVKEHWAALGLPLSLATCALAWSWDPRREPDARGPRGLLFACALLLALCVWFPAIVGLIVTAQRAV
jgi:hypothetical protein